MHKGEPDYQEVAEFKNGGYNVDMNVIAVDGYESFLCCIERDIALIKSGLDPRRVTKAIMTECTIRLFKSYANLPKEVYVIV